MNQQVVIFVVMVLIGVVAFLIGWSWPTVKEEPKAFGLEAYETYGLHKASDDVLEAVHAVVSFLGHSFTVVEEANDARDSAVVRSNNAQAEVKRNLQVILNLESDNRFLGDKAKMADARANDLSALVAHVNSVLGE